MKKVTCKRNNRYNSGITMIALIVTVIVLIILAGISINLILGDNGILKWAKYSVNEYQEAAQEEQNELISISNNIDKMEISSRNNTDTMTNGLQYVGLFTTQAPNTEYVKNNANANIKVTGLSIGKQYFAIIGRATTGGANATWDDRGVSFTNATYMKFKNYFYNFVPTSDEVIITCNSVSFAPSCGGHSYAFIFEGKME